MELTPLQTAIIKTMNDEIRKDDGKNVFEQPDFSGLFDKSAHHVNYLAEALLDLEKKGLITIEKRNPRVMRTKMQGTVIDVAHIRLTVS